MTGPTVQIYPDLDALSSAAAAVFAATAKSAAEAGADAWIALSGGSTPRRQFETLARLPWRERVAWDRVRVCQVDERPVPPDHPDSNYGMLKECLLDRVPIPPGNVHRIAAELGPEVSAQAYEDELRASVPTEGGLPRFSLVFLGMGDDGHTASLFPESGGLKETERWVIANPVPKLGATRITLTFPVLNAAARAVFLVSGESKAATVLRVLRGGRNVHEFPAQGIRPVDGELIWVMDAAAGSLLGRPAGPAAC